MGLAAAEHAKVEVIRCQWTGQGLARVVDLLGSHEDSVGRKHMSQHSVTLWGKP